MAHVEKREVEALDLMWQNNQGFQISPDAVTTHGGKTVNQLYLAVACATMWSRVRGQRLPVIEKAAAIADAMDVLNRSKQYGHQATGTNFANEFAAAAPHDDLHHAAWSTLLHEADVQHIPELLDAMINYYAEHLAMLRPFWTAKGVRMPCSRALRGDPGVQLRPQWPADSWLFSALTGATASALPKPTPRTVAWMRASATHWPEIVKRSETVSLKLQVPIRKWAREGGGFFAALVPSPFPIFDVMPAVEVDGNGDFVNTWIDLGNFPVPSGDPVIIGGGITAPDVAPTPAQPPPTGPEPSRSLDLGALASQIAGLRVPHSQAGLQAALVAELRAGPTRPLAAIADDLATFGIGDGQEQAAGWKAAIASLRGATS